MATFKCKMCGGELSFETGSTVCECEYCGSRQTLPRLDDDKKANLYDRANHFRRNNDYDKAMGIYEQLLAEDTADAEAYWSIVLCRYGIEYVEDPATHKRVPTVNRAQYTSIYADEDYKSALKYADISQKAIYEAEAKAIDDIQKGILEISSKEAPFDVFICYKETDADGRRTQDSVLANDLYHQLTQEGFKVFFSRITLEDKLGTAYEPYIFAALNSAKVMVVLGTKPEYFKAVWVKNEWSRYLTLVKNSNGRKTLIPAYRDMDPYELPEEFSHLQAQDMSKLGFMQDLIRGIRKIISVANLNETVHDGGKRKMGEDGENAGVSGNTVPLLKRAQMFLEDGDWKSADEYCEKVLDINPENAQAYLYKLMAKLEVHTPDDLKDCGDPFDESEDDEVVKYYEKAMRFADDKLKEKLQSDIDYINNGIHYYWANRCKSDIKPLESCIDGDLGASAFRLEVEAKKLRDSASMFERIGDFKDASKLAADCLAEADKYCEEAEKLRQEQMRIAETISSTLSNKKIYQLIAELKEEQEKLTIWIDRIGELVKLRADSEAQLKAAESQKYEIEESISSLKKERQQLGFFAGKRKKLIDLDLSIEDTKLPVILNRISIARSSVEECNEELKKGLSREQAESRLNEIKMHIIQNETTIRNDELSLDEANKKLDESESLRRLVFSKSPSDALLSERRKDIKAGDIIQFGSYKQHEQWDELIEWIVLRREGDKVLLISRCGLDSKPYDMSEAKEAEINWGSCTLREWLNVTFMNEAFSTEEKKRILTTEVSVDQFLEGNGEDDTFKKKCLSAPVRDKIFLLSVDEAEKYFKSYEERKCYPTPYAVDQGAYDDSFEGVNEYGFGPSFWWLRSCCGMEQRDAAQVSICGDIYFGEAEDREGNKKSTHIAIRPALWIDVNM